MALTINGQAVHAPRGASVAAALLIAGAPSRTSITGEPRTAMCGMGICMECRAIVDGTPHVRTCQMPAREGMVVRTE